MPTHKTNPHCSSTPAADPSTKRVVVWHGSAGLFCYDFEGNQIWERQLGEFRHMWGYASSPVIHRGTVLLHCGPGERVFLTAIDLKSGDTIWETVEKLDGGDAERSKEGHYRGSWSTPVVRRVGGASGRETVICSMPTRVVGLDFKTGDLVWYCDGLKGSRGELAYTSPVFGDEDICLSVGGFNGPAILFRAGETGNITKGRRIQRFEKNPQSIGSGIFHDGYFYVPGAGPANIRCINPNTGEDARWTDPAGGKPFWGSIVLAGKRAYVVNQAGTTIVFEPSPGSFKQVAANDLGEPCNTTPAISGGQVFLRTDKALYCIGKPDAR